MKTAKKPTTDTSEKPLSDLSGQGETQQPDAAVSTQQEQPPAAPTGPVIADRPTGGGRWMRLDDGRVQRIDGDE